MDRGEFRPIVRQNGLEDSLCALAEGEDEILHDGKNVLGLVLPIVEESDLESGPDEHDGQKGCIVGLLSDHRIDLDDAEILFGYPLAQIPGHASDEVRGIVHPDIRPVSPHVGLSEPLSGVSEAHPVHLEHSTVDKPPDCRFGDADVRIRKQGGVGTHPGLYAGRDLLRYPPDFLGRETHSRPCLDKPFVGHQLRLRTVIVVLAEEAGVSVLAEVAEPIGHLFPLLAFPLISRPDDMVPPQFLGDGGDGCMQIACHLLQGPFLLDHSLDGNPVLPGEMSSVLLFFIRFFHGP